MSQFKSAVAAVDSLEPQTPGIAPIVRDHIAAHIELSWDELFALDRAEVERFQLRSAQRRFEELTPKVKLLKGQVDAMGITAIRSLEDLVPLLFKDAVYKAYPISLIEKNRFDQLTQWIAGLTSLDLSGVDVRGVEGIDSWLDTLEAQTNLRVFHTSGTSGKLSFLPRSTVEDELYFEGMMKLHAGFGEDEGVKLGGKDDIRLPVVFPSWRYGRSVAQRVLRHTQRRVAPTPEECYTLTNGTLSADLLALSGRIRIAQAKGQLHEMKLSDPMRVALKRYLEEQERRPQEGAQFFVDVAEKLRGKRVYIQCVQSLLVSAAKSGLARGLSNVFAPDSAGGTGGGAKGVEMPENWQEILKTFTGIPRWRRNYGMTEMLGGMRLCDDGYYHIPPYYVPFLLDPKSGGVLARSGTVTGQFAFLDLLSQTLWGGIVTGDRVTIEWDRQCGCGRKGAHMHSNIMRYSELAAEDGDDKISCAATVDRTDAALKALVNI
jgi:hypothetical protein